MKGEVMFVDVKLPMPPRPSGPPNAQVEQLWRYLYQLVERLNARGDNNVRGA